MSRSQEKRPYSATDQQISAVRLQSWWRGVQTRKLLNSCKQDYEEIMRDIETSEDIVPHWKKDCCVNLPIVGERNVIVTICNKNSVQNRSGHVSCDDHGHEDSSENNKENIVDQLFYEQKDIGLTRLSPKTDKTSSSGSRPTSSLSVCFGSSHSKNSQLEANQNEDINGFSEPQVKSAETQTLDSPSPRSRSNIELGQRQQTTQTHHTNDETSVWLSPDSQEQKKTEQHSQTKVSEKQKQELKEEYKALTMELLWVHQAINSRKQYLNLKNQMVPT